ncbi:MAG: hypothetical protein UHN88_06290 [Eubacterium sp.]|nr:hypothetical protein [Eubacterium sp.]
MARRHSTAYEEARRRVNSTRSGNRYYRLQESYEDGNAVRVLEEQTEEEIIEQAKPKVSARTRENRARAKSMSVGYVLFLGVMCIVSMAICIHYLRLRSDLITQTETIAEMETSLSKLQADNDAYYKQAQASVSMDDVKNTALNTLGMHYATESQIRYYNADNESYVRQYESVPSGE